MIALEPGQQWLPHFKLIKELAVGKDKRPRVWLAAKEGSGEQVVLKFLRSGPPSPLLIRRLADWRATIVPGFMPLLGVHTAGDQMAIELPFVEGDNSALRGAPYAQWSVWLEQVVETLATLHRDGFIHGDVKLGNLRRDARGLPILADPWLPGDGKSPFTASPERLQGGSISAADDRYAVGALIHELVTAYPPRYPGTQSAQNRAPASIPEEVATVMNALLSATAEERPSFERVLACLAPLNETDPQPESAASKTLRRPAAQHTGARLPQPPRPAPPPTQSPPRAREVALEIVRTPVARPPMSAAPLSPPRAAVPARVMPASRPAAPAPAPVPAQNRSAPLVVTPPPVVPPPTPSLEVTPLVAGTPSWARPADRLAAQGFGSPFPSRIKIWLWPALLVLIVAAIAVFVWLPQEVKDSALTEVTQMATRAGLVPANVAPKAAEIPDLRNLGEKKLAAESARDRASALQSDLINSGVTARPLPAYVAGADAFNQAVQNYDRREFAAANKGFLGATRSFETARAALPQLHAAALAAGDAALAQCLRDQAIEEYRYALALVPGDRAAQQGIVRARVCEQVIARINAGSAAEQAGDVSAAQSNYQSALQLDPNSPAAQRAAGSLSGRESDERFSRQIAAALESIRLHQYGAAATAIAAADRMRPGSPDVQRLNSQLDEVRSSDRLRALSNEAADDERNEKWSEALASYRAMLGIDATLVTAQQGAARSDERVSLDAELASYIDAPERLSAAEVRNAASAAATRGQSLPARGPRLDSQLSKVESLLSQFDSPLPVALKSDGLTDVTILRIGRVGTFTDRSVSLKPGKYVVVGSRLGYRDVRHELNVAPGSNMRSVDIRCEEQI